METEGGGRPKSARVEALTPAAVSVSFASCLQKAERRTGGDLQIIGDIYTQNGASVTISGNIVQGPAVPLDNGCSLIPDAFFPCAGILVINNTESPHSHWQAMLERLLATG